jgi:hypothetical protein
MHAGLCRVRNLNGKCELYHTAFSAGYGLFDHVALGQVLRNGTVWRVAGFIAQSLWIRMLVN